MENIIEIKNLHFAYGKHEVLHGVNIAIAPKEIVGLVGLNGSGKSTLLDTICNVKKQSAGEIFVAGEQGSRNVKKLIGYMPQSFGLFHDLTVWENIKYISTVFGIFDNNVIEQIIKTCRLDAYKNVYASNLSGGYKQLLSLACALVHNPKMLILDEPTSAMDPIFRAQFWDIVQSYNNKDTTILVTTHYLEEMSKTDRIILLDAGKIAWQGKYEDLQGEELIKIYNRHTDVSDEKTV